VTGQGLKDVASEIKAIHRAVTRRRPTEYSDEEVAVLLRRSYPAEIEDVWEALTNPDRVKRWFLPISGDLRVGGSFQTEGNAGGEILACDAPRLLRVSWGGPTSIVELRLSEGDGATSVELEHTVPLEIAGSGAGALFVGPGWDLTLLGLGHHVDDPADDLSGWDGTPEGLQFSAGSIEAWTAVVQASGTATTEEIGGGVAMARAQFTVDPDV
jgi:uncharacterized protein YndB with AHSA1/START domain